MSTHTEDTKEMTVEDVRSKLNKIYLRLAYGKSDIEKTKQEVDQTLTTYASQVREKRDREILAELDRLDGDTTEPIPSRKHNWYYGYADCLVEVKKFITTLTQKT